MKWLPSEPRAHQTGNVGRKMTSTDPTAGQPAGVQLIEAARALFPTIRAEAENAEKAGKIPAHVYASLKDRGFLRILLPRRFGGYELDLETAVSVVLELSAACGSTGWVAACGISHQWMVAQFPLGCQEEIWRDGPDKMVVTSFPPTGDCEPVDGGFRINGTWRYASGCDYADVALLGVMLPPANGDDRAVPGFVVVPMADCEQVDDWDTMGLAATGSHAVVARDVFIPAYRSIAAQVFGSTDTPGQQAFETNLGRYPVFSLGAHGLSATAVGCLKGALDDYVGRLTDWQTRGSGASSGANVADFPAVQMRVGQAAASLKAAKALMFAQIEETRRAVVDQGALLGRAERLENRVVQAYVVQLALQGLDALWGAAGATGIHHGEPVQRAWRDAHAVSHHAFFNWDVLSAMYGQDHLGLEPRGAPY